MCRGAAPAAPRGAAAVPPLPDRRRCSAPPLRRCPRRRAARLGWRPGLRPHLRAGPSRRPRPRRAAPISNAGAPPFIQCFIGGNSHPTIPYRFKDDRRIGHASADTQRDWGNCSRLYEVRIWMWRNGRGRPRMVSIAKAESIRAERRSENRVRAAETRKHSS